MQALGQAASLFLSIDGEDGIAGRYGDLPKSARCVLEPER